jgi:hypothetical protein
VLLGPSDLTLIEASVGFGAALITTGDAHSTVVGWTVAATTAETAILFLGEIHNCVREKL